MKLSPKGSQSSNQSAVLKIRDLVCYENDRALRLAAIVGEQTKGKFTILNDLAERFDLAPARLHRLPVTSTNTTSDGALVEFLKASAEKARALTPDIVRLSSLCEPGRPYRNDELTVKMYQQDGLVPHLALRLALIQDRIFFARQGEFFIARSKEQVEAARREEERRIATEQAQGQTLLFFRTRLAGKMDQPSPVIERELRLLMELAAGCRTEDSKEHQAAHLLIKFLAENLDLHLLGSKQERACALLLRTGVITQNTNLSLIRHRIQSGFSSEILEQAQELSERAATLGDSLADLSLLETFTIDDSSTEDIDDAVSIEEIPGGFRIGVHISAVALAIPDRSPLNQVASSRASSIYSPELIVNMLPPVLCNDRCSLVPGAKRPVLSYLFDLDSRFNILKSELKLATIVSKNKFSYHEADELLGANHRLLEIAYEFGAALEAQRISQGGFRVEKRDVTPVIDANGVVSLQTLDEAAPTRAMIGEFMILVNKFSAEYAAKNSLPFLYRGQPEPEEQSGTDSVPVGPARDYAVRATLLRSTTGFRPMPHATLGLKAYAQVSAPIRRFTDLCNQRQLISHLTQGTSHYPTIDEFVKAIEPADDPQKRAQAAQRESKRFWLMRYLEQERSRSPMISGTVIRTDMKHPLVELDKVFFSVTIKPARPVKLGEQLELRIIEINPHLDHLRLEL